MTALLLDTHAALWWWRCPEKLSSFAAAEIAAARDVRVSSISAFEIAQKWRLGKLDMIEDPAVHFAPLMRANGFASLPVSQNHALTAALFSHSHKDPFDRMIAAQALAEGLTVVTCDPEISVFGCKVLW